MVSLDCYAGFHQVPLEPASRPLTAFITGRGLYEFKRLPFGVKQGPGCFARLMNFVLSGLLFTSAMVYLDDILVAGKTFDEMLSRLEEVFLRLQQFNIKLKLKKCKFGCHQLPFLGMLLTPGGIKPDRSNIEKIADAPPPSNLTEVRAFLGCANFYRKFIPHFALIMKPITSLLKKSAPFDWSAAREVARKTVCDTLTSLPLLVYPSFDQEFILCTDASAAGCGAVLAQQHNGREAPIAFYSRSFNKAQSKYPTVERELFAIVLALKHFKHLVYGRRVVIYSDQRSLSWGIKQTDSARMMKWIAKLSEFDITIFYRPGSKMGPADYLSRTFAPQHSDSLDIVYSTDLAYAVFDLSIENSRQFFAKEQLNDPLLACVIGLKTYRPLSELNPDLLTDAQSLAKSTWYHPEFGCLYKVHGAKSLLVVPDSLKSRVLSEAHDVVYSGHLGAKRTADRILEKFYWRNLQNDVNKYASFCHDCLEPKPLPGPLKNEWSPSPHLHPG